jgi:AcrR family transcriptional regulator
MSRPTARSYHSAIRQRQAEETRRRIAEAARRLFVKRGYAGTTIDAVARRAGVAPQTVYAVFASKRGLLAEIMDRATFGPAYQELVQQALATRDPSARVRFAARIARQVHDSWRGEIDLLRGAGVVAPELAALEREREGRRFEAQRPVIDYLVETGRVRRDLDFSKARDILWALTGRELYRNLVVERGWSSDRYEDWLADLLVSALVKSP